MTFLVLHFFNQEVWPFFSFDRCCPKFGFQAAKWDAKKYACCSRLKQTLSCGLNTSRMNLGIIYCFRPLSCLKPKEFLRSLPFHWVQGSFRPLLSEYLLISVWVKTNGFEKFNPKSSENHSDWVHFQGEEDFPLSFFCMCQHLPWKWGSFQRLLT